MSFGYFASDLIGARLADATRSAEGALHAGPPARTGGGRLRWPRRLRLRGSVHRSRPQAGSVPRPRAEIDLTERTLAHSIDE